MAEPGKRRRDGVSAAKGSKQWLEDLRQALWTALVGPHSFPRLLVLGLCAQSMLSAPAPEPAPGKDSYEIMGWG